MRITKFTTKKLPAINGVPDPGHIDFIKQTLLFDSLRNKLDLVKTEEEYPTESTIEIDFSLDVYIIPAKRYEELLLIESKFKNLKNE